MALLLTRLLADVAGRQLPLSLFVPFPGHLLVSSACLLFCFAGMAYIMAPFSSVASSFFSSQQ